jgi:hypothetical protein
VKPACVVINDLTSYGPRRSELAIHCPQEGGDTDAALACVALALIELERITGRVLTDDMSLVVAAARIEGRST